MVPLELAEETSRDSAYNSEENEKSLEIDQAAKELLVARYNKKVKSQELEVGDLVLRRADIGGKNAAQGKLGANWEGPYQVVKVHGK
ncbi:hypothetical protein PIB30_008322 [Stylosanthes scabra]|uniref:Reverse transcriptase domain-containing protein n=1 Tax=Stylosanthes scabra TaxID=79078 RepID=A0ABU6S5F9_9FABA|nr:hypothetical protein [Stylosanthes scabra]